MQRIHIAHAGGGGKPTVSFVDVGLKRDVNDVFAGLPGECRKMLFRTSGT